MSCCGGTSGGLERYPGTGCCGTSCAAEKTGCPASEPRIRSCLCQENVGCLDRAECGGFRPRGTAATGACPGPCQCVEEEAWNRNVPPKPNCEWLTNFSELRRQWSDHGRQNNCKCCNCKPCRTAAPCKPCLPPVPRCSTIAFPPENCHQECCNDRLSGGACGGNTRKFCSTYPRQLDYGSLSAMTSFPGNCQSPSSCDRPSACCSSGVKLCPLPCDSPSECSLTKCAPSPCQPPSSCQPCSPSPRPILKKRSCCQCITGACMCQPMPRNCNCPPPVQVDAKSEKECSCECPSSPECACPPSERKFPRSKVKCPNARLCCPTPRPQPGPKCRCTKCQPCLPPPCDPCTSSKCRTITPKIKPCCGDSPCDDDSPCRSDTPRSSSPCRPTPPCSDCRKMSPPCRTSQFESSRQALRHIRPLNRPRSPDFRCPVTSGYHRSDEGCGEDNGDAADTANREAQCHCGALNSRGCDVMCDYCCSLNCDDDILADETKNDDNNVQCNCGNGTRVGHHGCHEKCDYCCSVKCADHPSDSIDRDQCCCDADGKGCAKNCDHCCSLNCDSETPVDTSSNDKEVTLKKIKDKKKDKRIAAGGTTSIDQLRIYPSDHSNVCAPELRAKNRVILGSIREGVDEITRSSMIDSDVDNRKSLRSMFRRADVTVDDDDDENDNEDSQDVAKIRKSQSPKVKISSAVAKSRRSPCRLLRSLIRAKSPSKNFKTYVTVCGASTVDPDQRPNFNSNCRPSASSRSSSSSSSCSILKPSCIPLCPNISKRSNHSALLSFLENVSHTILVPGPLALVSFVLLILLGLTSAFGLALYRRYMCAKKLISTATRMGTNYRDSVAPFVTKELDFLDCNEKAFFMGVHSEETSSESKELSAPINSQSRCSLTRCECSTIIKRDGDKGIVNSAIHANHEECSCPDDSSSISENPESSINCTYERETTTSRLKLVCDDERNVISSINLEI